MSSAIATANGLTVYVDGKVFTVNKSHTNFDRIKNAVKNKKWAAIASLVDYTTTIAAMIGGKLDNVEIVRSQIIMNGIPFPEAVSEKILKMRTEGYDIEPALRFLVKVRENPASSAQTELFLFCQANGFPIHEDGDIIAYKGVDKDYMDQHSHTVLNQIASRMNETQRKRVPYTTDNGVSVKIENGVTVISMDRFQVDDNRNQTCSRGLHFAAFDYVRDLYGGSRKMVLKINPRDVVSIPSDYNNQKGRCCRYEVIAEIGKPEEPGNPMPHQEVYTTADVKSHAKGKPTRTQVRAFILDKIANDCGFPDDRVKGSQWFKDEDATYVLVETAEKFGVDPVKVEYKSKGMTLDEMERLVYTALNI